MIARRTFVVVGAICLGGIVQSASAHVEYVDLSDPITSPGGVNGSTFSNFGWYAGTTPTLGDTHQLAGGAFFKFHLDQASRVSITFSDDGNAGLLNPAFSLYSGLLPDDGHDDSNVDPLNPKASSVTAELSSRAGFALSRYREHSVRRPVRRIAHVESGQRLGRMECHRVSDAGESCRRQLRFAAELPAAGR